MSEVIAFDLASPTDKKASGTKAKDSDGDLRYRCPSVMLAWQPSNRRGEAHGAH